MRQARIIILKDADSEIATAMDSHFSPGGDRDADRRTRPQTTAAINDEPTDTGDSS